MNSAALRLILLRFKGVVLGGEEEKRRKEKKREEGGRGKGEVFWGVGVEKRRYRNGFVYLDASDIN